MLSYLVVFTYGRCTANSAVSPEPEEDTNLTGFLLVIWGYHLQNKRLQNSVSFLSIASKCLLRVVLARCAPGWRSPGSPERLTCTQQDHDNIAVARLALGAGTMPLLSSATHLLINCHPFCRSCPQRAVGRVITKVCPCKVDGSRAEGLLHH